MLSFRIILTKYRDNYIPVYYIDRAGSSEARSLRLLGQTMNNSFWLLNSINLLSVVGNVSGYTGLHKRQGESLTNDLPAWLWDATGLGAAIEGAQWFLNDFVIPDTGPSSLEIPDTDSSTRKDPLSNLGVEPDIELNAIAAPAGDEECKPAIRMVIKLR